MKQYIVTELENALLQLPFETSSLSLLETKPISRIQIISAEGSRALKSIDDCHRKIRIVMASVLTKIFLEFSEKNEERLATLKKIIYAAKLQQITEKKGIIRQHLLKSIAQKLRQLTIGNTAELQILKLFNLSPFFDEVVLEAIKEENSLILESDCELFIWLDRELDFKIVVTDQNLHLEHESELFMMGLGERFHPNKDCKSVQCTNKEYREFIRFSTQLTSEITKQQVEGIYDRKSRGEMFSRLIFQQQATENFSNDVNPNLYASVLSSSVDLGNSHTNTLSIKNPPRLKDTKRLDFTDSVSSATFSKNRTMKPTSKAEDQMELETGRTQKVIKIKRSKEQNQQSGLWSLLCCKF